MNASVAVPCPADLAASKRRRTLKHFRLAHRLWYQTSLPTLVARLFTGRIRVIGAERVPATGPVLYIGRHRAGLMDGWLYAHALPRQTLFVIAAKLRRNVLLRPLVAGIEVIRRKDGGNRAAANRAAMLACRAELQAGRTLFIFPEGTSTLGPSHLPLEPGAALLAAAVPGTAIVPVSIQYIEPTQLGTDVEIEFGHPVRPKDANPAALQAEIEAAVHSVGADFPDEVALGVAQVRARAAWALGGSYAAALRDQTPACAPPPPSGWRLGLARLADTPVMLLASCAARRLADDDTAVLPWAVLIGVPLQLLWSAALLATLLSTGHSWLAAAYGMALATRLLPRTERRHA